MIKIYFRYKLPNGSDYISLNLGCANFSSKIKSSGINSTTLRGFAAEKFLYATRVWTIIIPPKSLANESNLAFMQNFFLYPDRAISLDNSNWRSVSLSAGDFPVEFLESSKYLQQLTLNLTSKTADISLLTGEHLFGIEENSLYG